MSLLAEDDLVGRTLGKCELHQLLGSGGMGTVYRARQTSPNREVAVKILRAFEQGSAARFAREAQVLADLEHPHVVPIYDYGLHDGISYIVMRLMLGGSLSDRLHNQRLTTSETLRLVDELSDALDYAHLQGVVHRDLKPSNVLYDRQGKAYLADFGVAKLYSGVEHLTATGRQPGTPAYMAPELWREQEPSAATDIYALGIIVYEILTGVLPFVARTWLEWAGLHLTRQHRPPHSMDPAIPRAVDHVLSQALAKDPHSRFSTARAFADALKRALDDQAGDEVTSPALAGPRSVPDTRQAARETTTIPGKSDATSTSIGQATAQAMPVPSPKANPVSRRIIPLVAAVLLVLAGATVALAAVVGDGPVNPTPAPTDLPTPASPPSQLVALPVLTLGMAGSDQEPATPAASPSRTPAATASPATPGARKPARQRIDGLLTVEETMATVRAEWARGDVVDLHLHSRDFDAHLTLRDANGDEIASNDDCAQTYDACLMGYVVPASGVYLIEVGSLDHQSIGRYTLETTNYGPCGPLPVVVIIVDSPNLRQSPVMGGQVLAILGPDECFPILERTADNDWYRVAAPDGQTGWLYQSVVAVVGEVSEAPVAQ